MTPNPQTTHPRYPAYRDSGVEWIGEIPSHWRVKKLKFLGNIYPGLSGKKGEDFSKEPKEGLKPYVPFTNISNNRIIDSKQVDYVRLGKSESQNKVLPKDLLFLMSSETLEDIGKCSIFLEEGYEIYLNSFCKGFRIQSEDLMPAFANYLFSGSGYRTYFSIYGRGFTRINIRQDFVNNLLTLLPPLPEQRAIARFLDEKTAQIDRAIGQKQRLIELLQERRQVLIQQAVTRGLDPSVPLRESGVDWMGEVPGHWEVRRAKYLFKEVDERSKDGAEVLFSLRMHIGLIPHHEVSDIEITSEQLKGYKKVAPGQIVMNRMRAAIGLFGVVYRHGLVSPDYATFNVLPGAFADYYMSLFRLEELRAEFRLNSKGLGTGSSGFMRLYSDSFGRIKMPAPPLAEQQAIVSHIESQSAQIERAIALQQRHIAQLREYRSVLIHEVVTGKVKVVRGR